MVDMSSVEDDPSAALSSDNQYDLEDFSNVPNCLRSAHVWVASV